MKNKFNNKGFTLVELIATIVILGIVMSLGTYAIVNLINNSNEENYKLLIEEIKNAGELYYQECKYMKTDEMDCDGTITLGYLVKYGYLKGNSSDNNDKYTIVNTKDDVDISDCGIKIAYVNGKINVDSVSSGESCPTEY